MESTYWCRWNGKSWEPFLLQPLTQDFDSGEPDTFSEAEKEHGSSWEKKGFRDGYLAGCVVGRSFLQSRALFEQDVWTEPISEDPVWRTFEKDSAVVTKSQRKSTKTKSRHKLKDRKNSSCVYNKTSRESAQVTSSVQFPSGNHIEKAQHEIQELEASIDAQYIRVLRERNPPLWPVLGLNLGSTAS